MKTSKRILGVVLALTMIFNVFAVGTFAAGTETAVDLYLSSDKATYAAGDEIVLTVSAQAVSAVGDLRIGGQYAIAYNSAIVEPYSEAVDSLTAHEFVALQEGYDASISSLADASMTSVDAKNGWDKVIIYNCCDDGATSFSATEKVDLFTIKMKVKADAADGETVIGFNQTSYEDYNAYINDAAMGGIYGYNDDYGYGTAANYGFNNVTIKVGAAVEVTHVKQQSKWNGGNDKNTAENYLFGFVGQLSGLELTTEKVGERTMVTNIQSITATATVTGGTQSVEAEVVTVWAVDGGYQFRAQFAGFAPTSDATATVTFAVTTTDGQTYYSVEEARVINEIYADSLANNFPALAA